MTYTINTSPDISNILPPQYSRSENKDSSSTPTNLIGRKTENRLLNTQARIEYELLKFDILAGVSRINKLLDLDDQIIKQEYKLCTSLTYRRQIFVLEFRQLPTDSKLYNHSLELIFQGSNPAPETSGRSKLILIKDKSKFLWRPLNPDIGGPSGTSKILANLILSWLQDENSLFMRFTGLG